MNRTLFYIYIVNNSPLIVDYDITTKFFLKGKKKKNKNVVILSQEKEYIYIYILYKLLPTIGVL